MKKYLLGFFLLTILSCTKKETTTTVTDKIRSSLSTSQVAYDAAAANNWVNVTAAEYNNLLTILSGTGKYGASESNMTTSSYQGWTADYTVGGNANATKVPASSYIIAWSVHTGIGTSSSLGSKLKVSASQTSGYTDYGGTLPDIGTITADTRVYFVLKTPSVLTPSSASYTAVYQALLGFLGVIIGSSGPEYYDLGDSAAPATSYGTDSHSQVIATATKQW